jgi:hypothetical protein
MQRIWKQYLLTGIWHHLEVYRDVASEDSGFESFYVPADICLRL